MISVWKSKNVVVYVGKASGSRNRLIANPIHRKRNIVGNRIAEQEIILRNVRGVPPSSSDRYLVHNDYYTVHTKKQVYNLNFQYSSPKVLRKLVHKNSCFWIQKTKKWQKTAFLFCFDWLNAIFLGGYGKFAMWKIKFMHLFSRKWLTFYSYYATIHKPGTRIQNAWCAFGSG